MYFPNELDIFKARNWLVFFIPRKIAWTQLEYSPSSSILRPSLKLRSPTSNEIRVSDSHTQGQVERQKNLLMSKVVQL